MSSGGSAPGGAGGSGPAASGAAPSAESTAPAAETSPSAESPSSSEQSKPEKSGDSGANDKKKSRLSSGLGALNDFRNDYRNAGGLAGMAKNKINDKIHDKIDEKKQQIKDNVKNKINDKIPESVKKKQEALKNKGQQMKDKINAPKKKLEEGKAKLNEKAFKSAVKGAADAMAPGTGTVAEKLLDTEKGAPALDEAKAASDPISGIAKGTKKLVEIVLKEQVKKTVLIKIVPIIVAILVVMMIPAMFSKVFDSEIFFKGYSESDSTGEIVDEEYEAFYKNIEKYGGINPKMVVAVLTAYEDNDVYGKDGDYESDCTDDELENGTCFSNNSNVSDKSKKQMKKYIKKVAKKIENSGDIAEGDYDDPENTGSEFFQWLYKDFVEDYYSDYLKGLNKEEKVEKKKDIIDSIYLYYKELSDNDITSAGVTYSSCPNGITVTGYGTYDLDEYVAGVIAHENYTNYMEAMKAQAVAARTYALAKTNNCTKPIENSTNAQTFYPPEKVRASYSKAMDAAKETSGQVLTYKGEIFSSEYDSFNGTCSGGTCTAVYTKIPSSETHTVTIPESFLETKGGHGRGMSQCGANYMASTGSNYKEILKYYYAADVEISTMTAQVVGDLYAFGGSGLFAESFFPISKADINRVYKSAGWYYPSGKFHGATDIACYWGGSAKNCHTIGIYSAHEGVVTKIGTAQCNGWDAGAAAKTGLPYVSGCIGTFVQVRINSGAYTGYEFWYYHLSSVADGLKVGDQIPAGQLLGYMGNTGRSTGPHLHFQLNDPRGNRTNFNDAVNRLLASVK